MALSPFSLFSMPPRYRDWWDFGYSSRLMDQHFGLGLLDSDLDPPVVCQGYVMIPRTRANLSSSGSSEVSTDRDKFQVILNVEQFRPEEISVKTVDNYILIHGKHEEKQDEHGLISREFTRCYMLPQEVEPETVTSSLYPDHGMITVQVPRKSLEPLPQNERVVPISKKHPAAVETQQSTNPEEKK